MHREYNISENLLVLLGYYNIQVLFPLDCKLFNMYNWLFTFTSEPHLKKFGDMIAITLRKQMEFSDQNSFMGLPINNLYIY